MSLICGADGCRAGWIAVHEETLTGRVGWRVVPSLAFLADVPPKPDLIAVDIPIGLPEVGARECDVAARRLLGPRRGRSVFPAPLRRVLSARSHREAGDEREKAEGKRVSIQAYAITPKVREVDQLLRSQRDLRERVREVHPELCFYHLAGGQPMQCGKKSPEGQAERLDLLRRAFGASVDTALGERRRLGCTADDILDSFAALWTARRILRGEAVVLPATPARDAFGLPMEMVA